MCAPEVWREWRPETEESTGCRRRLWSLRNSANGRASPTRACKGCGSPPPRGWSPREKPYGETRSDQSIIFFSPMPPTLTENGILTRHPAEKPQWSTNSLSQITGSSQVRQSLAVGSTSGTLVFLCLSLPSMWVSHSVSGYSSSGYQATNKNSHVERHSNLFRGTPPLLECAIGTRPDDLKDVIHARA